MRLRSTSAKNEVPPSPAADTSQRKALQMLLKGRGGITLWSEFGHFFIRFQPLCGDHKPLASPKCGGAQFFFFFSSFFL
eukprot:3375849-Amphidinium_carterae.1